MDKECIRYDNVQSRRGEGGRKKGKGKKRLFAGWGGEAIIYALCALRPRSLLGMHSTLSTLRLGGQGRGVWKLRYPTCIGGTYILGN